jgi:protein TonB
MFRLRTTTALSLLALAVGVAGTAWLSEQTAGWAGPARMAASDRAPRPAAVPHRGRAPMASARVHVAHLPPIDGGAQASAAPAPPAVPMLTPVEMPSAPADFFSRREARQGRVMLNLSVDGQGHVTHAAVDESSGDPQLDQEAVRTVQRWRFAVPADHPEGISGNLPMSFKS